jgi:hypothetical protein
VTLKRTRVEEVEQEDGTWHTIRHETTSWEGLGTIVLQGLMILGITAVLVALLMVVASSVTPR